MIDGAKGMRAAVREVFGDVPVQRCQWHKRENVVSYLAVGRARGVAAEAPSGVRPPRYADAKRALQRLVRELQVSTRRRPRVSRKASKRRSRCIAWRVPELGVSFKTTNLIESVMSRLEARTRRITRWRTSDQKLRWCASALWAMERQFRRVKGIAT